MYVCMLALKTYYGSQYGLSAMQASIFYNYSSFCFWNISAYMLGMLNSMWEWWSVYYILVCCMTQISENHNMLTSCFFSQMYLALWYGKEQFYSSFHIFANLLTFQYYFIPNRIGSPSALIPSQNLAWTLILLFFNVGCWVLIGFIYSFTNLRFYRLIF